MKDSRGGETWGTRGTVAEESLGEGGGYSRGTGLENDHEKKF